MGVGGQRHATAALPWERPGTHRIGDWVCPRGRSGQMQKTSLTPGFDPRTIQSAASRYTD